MSTTGKPLVPGTDGDRRLYLDGIGLHCGDIVEIELRGGRWERVRLEGMPQELLGYGLIQLAAGEELPVSLPATASYRWPER